MVIRHELHIRHIFLSIDDKIFIAFTWSINIILTARSFEWPIS